MANVFNQPGYYKEDWKEKLQEQLDEPKYWKKVCKVEYTDSRVIHNPYQNDATAVSYTRGNQYNYTDITVTEDTTDINITFVAPEFIDRADYAQTTYDMLMERAERQADALHNEVERAVLREHVNAGNTVDAGTVTSANIIDTIRRVRREIVIDEGLDMLNRMGASIIWDPERFDLLTGAAQDNGFAMSDAALKDGRVVFYSGFTHYESNLLEETATDGSAGTGQLHCVGLVNGAIHVGILNHTYGDVMVDDRDPNRQSGTSFVSRIDFATKIWNNMAPLVVDITVATA